MQTIDLFCLAAGMFKKINHYQQSQTGSAAYFFLLKFNIEAAEMKRRVLMHRQIPRTFNPGSNPPAM